MLLTRNPKTKNCSPLLLCVNIFNHWTETLRPKPKIIKVNRPIRRYLAQDREASKVALLLEKDASDSLLKLR